MHQNKKQWRTYDEGFNNIMYNIQKINDFMNTTMKKNEMV
jgi:hypothetical protein